METTWSLFFEIFWEELIWNMLRREWTDEEIAKVLSIPESVVRAMIRRGE